MTKWLETTLGDACELYQPKTIASSELVDDGPFPVYGANGVIGRFHRFNHEDPQLLITCRGATCGSVNVSSPKAWINGNAMVVRPKTDAIALKYLEHMFRGGIDLTAAITGAAQPQITRQSLAPIRVSFPPLPEQRRIAAILDQADALRAKRRDALAQLDKLTQAIFVEMFGDYRTKKNSWPIKTFGQIASDMKVGLVRSSEEFGQDFDVPYIRMNALGRRGEFLPELVQCTHASYEEISEYKIQPGDFLFNTRNSKELVGKTAIFRGPGIYVYNNNIMRVRFIETVEPEYIAAAFLTPYIQHELENRKSGTTSVFAIYGRELKSLPIPIPPIALQQGFATRIRAIEAQKAKHRVSWTQISALIFSLQHRAFRGEL